jgi:peroxiredoxin
VSLVVGAAFPVDVVLDSSGGPARMSDMLRAGPLVVAFHRLWCPFCQQAARELVAVKDQLDALQARVVIVYSEPLEFVGRACARRGIPFDCLSDSRRELAMAAQIRNFSIGRYVAFSPRKLIRAVRSGSQIGKVTTDLLQGRATFVVDQNSRIVYAHNSVNAADIAPTADVLAAVRSAADIDMTRGRQ